MTGEMELNFFILEFGREMDCKLFILACKLFILDFGSEMDCKVFILDFGRKKVFICGLQELRFVCGKIIDVRAVFGTAVRAGTRILECAGLNLKFSTEQFVFSETNKVGRMCT